MKKKLGLGASWGARFFAKLSPVLLFPSGPLFWQIILFPWAFPGLAFFAFAPWRPERFFFFFFWLWWEFFLIVLWVFFSPLRSIFRPYRAISRPSLRFEKSATMDRPKKKLLFFSNPAELFRA